MMTITKSFIILYIHFTRPRISLNVDVEYYFINNIQERITQWAVEYLCRNRNNNYAGITGSSSTL